MSGNMSYIKLTEIEATVSSKGQVTLPKALRDHLGLHIGSRIRFAVNGKEVLDWTDPKPELCEAGPIGLQLHSNKVPQEVRFRGLVLVEDPTDVLVTASPTP